jgi:two-component system response regulator AtoC
MSQAQSNYQYQQLLLSEEYYSESTPSVLLAEADKEVRKLLTYSLIKCGYSVIECSHGTELIRRLGILATADNPDKVDLIISDIHMPGISGLEVLKDIKNEGGFPPFILISASRDKVLCNQAKRFGAVSIFGNPFDVDELLVKVMKIVPPESHIIKNWSGSNKPEKKTAMGTVELRKLECR